MKTEILGKREKTDFDKNKKYKISFIFKKEFCSKQIDVAHFIQSRVMTIVILHHEPFC